ncbi:hypothetical protein TNCV_1030371 [Trichonephila clavipes]|nr:hypothetical protein TNCV_1030371 [Trichonephila clavipes]
MGFSKPQRQFCRRNINIRCSKVRQWKNKGSCYVPKGCVFHRYKCIARMAELNAKRLMCVLCGSRHGYVQRLSHGMGQPRGRSRFVLDSVLKRS